MWFYLAKKAGKGIGKWMQKKEKTTMKERAEALKEKTISTKDTIKDSGKPPQYDTYKEFLKDLFDIGG